MWHLCILFGRLCTVADEYLFKVAVMIHHVKSIYCYLNIRRSLHCIAAIQDGFLDRLFNNSNIHNWKMRQREKKIDIKRHSVCLALTEYVSFLFHVLLY